MKRRRKKRREGKKKKKGIKWKIANRIQVRIGRRRKEGRTNGKKEGWEEWLINILNRGKGKVKGEKNDNLISIIFCIILFIIFYFDLSK